MPSRFSHSRLSTFENCPRQYRYRYVERLPVEGVGIEAHTGSTVHAVLERLYREKMQGRGIASLQEMRDWFAEEWQRVRPEDLRIVRRGFECEDYRRLGWHCVEAYYRRHHPFDESQQLSLEAKIEIPLGRHKLVGYIDRLARGADGAYEIHDYKTVAGWLPRPRDLDGDRQLALYEIGVRRTRPDVRRVRHVWHYLVFGRSYVRERPAAEIERLARDTVRLIRRVLAERVFAARPGILCHWCDFNDRCREGRDWVETRPAPGLRG